MRVERGWTVDGKPAVKVSASAFIDAEEFERIMRIAKKQDWGHKDAGEYIVKNGWTVFGDSFFTCGEEYDDHGSKIEPT